MGIMQQFRIVFYVVSGAVGLAVILLPGLHTPTLYNVCSVFAVVIALNALVRLRKNGLLGATPRELAVAFSTQEITKSSGLEKLAFFACLLASLFQYI